MCKDKQLNDFLIKFNYNPVQFYYIDVGGNDYTGNVDNISTPYKTFGNICTELLPGDAVVFRAGKYDINSCYIVGTEKEPIYLLAYPDEKVILNINEHAKIQHVIIHGFELNIIPKIMTYTNQ